MSDLRAIRVAAGYSQLRASVEAGTTPPTLRLYEDAGPSSITKPEIRRSLDELYAKLASIAAQKGQRAA